MHTPPFCRSSRSLIALLCGAVLLGPTGCAAIREDVPARVPKTDVQYLQDLAKGTWACINDMVDPDSQLPYDNLKRTEWTSATNIGLYVAALAAAVDMGFLPRADALGRLETLLVNVDTFVKWNGFNQCWNSVRTGMPAPHDPWVSILDSGNFYAGLVVGRGYFPELKQHFDRLIDPVDWSKVYNPGNHKLRFGYNRQTGKLGGDLDDLGSDSRLAYFLAVASGKVPPQTWTAAGRDLEERYGYQYFQPGWQGGGLFMQFISGLIIDERRTVLGLSAANFAYAQILHARKNAYWAWGWSSAEAPTGEYLGMNMIRDEVVTPHASALALPYYPLLVIANLRELEEAGARMPYEDPQGVNGTAAKDYGFRDSIDLKTRALSGNYLMLDQCMLFLSLANFLDHGVVWKAFRNDPLAKQGYARIADLQPKRYLVKTADRKRPVSVYELRDTDPALETDFFAKLAGPGVMARPYLTKAIKHAEAVRAPGPVVLDGKLDEWGTATSIDMTIATDTEIMKAKKQMHGAAKVSFMWDDEALYFSARVEDETLVFTQTDSEIWKDNLIELYLSPDPREFVWARPDCFQIGLAPSGPDGRPQAWTWFQGGAPGDNVRLAAQVGRSHSDGKSGYVVEAAIKWTFLKVKPGDGVVLGASPAVHFVDKTHENSLKLNWCFLPDGKSLGQLRLKK